MRTSKQFWDWFLAHEGQIWAIEGRDDGLMDEIQAALCALNEGLGFEISDESDGMRQLVISAMSDPTPIRRGRSACRRSTGTQSLEVYGTETATGF